MSELLETLPEDKLYSIEKIKSFLRGIVDSSMLSIILRTISPSNALGSSNTLQQQHHEVALMRHQVAILFRADGAMKRTIVGFFLKDLGLGYINQNFIKECSYG